MSLAHHTTKANARQHKLSTKRIISDHQHNGRLYRLLDVVTQDGLEYRCLRLYNLRSDGRLHFIKQFLFEPELSGWLKEALEMAEKQNRMTTEPDGHWTETKGS